MSLQFLMQNDLAYTTTTYKKTAYCSEYIKQNDDFRHVSAIHVSSLIQMNILLALERF